MAHKAKAQTPALPADCPVQPLGRRAGACCFLDAQGYVTVIPDTGWSAAQLEGLFAGKSNWLIGTWPRRGKPSKSHPQGQLLGVAVERARLALMDACAFVGAANQVEPRPGDQWHDGNGHLRAQATIAMLQGLSAIDAELIEALDALLYAAGPDFAQQQINDDFRARMPF